MELDDVLPWQWPFRSNIRCAVLLGNLSRVGRDLSHLAPSRGFVRGTVVTDRCWSTDIWVSYIPGSHYWYAFVCSWGERLASRQAVDDDNDTLWTFVRRYCPYVCVSTAGNNFGKAYSFRRGFMWSLSQSGTGSCVSLVVYQTVLCFPPLYGIGASRATTEPDMIAAPYLGWVVSSMCVVRYYRNSKYTSAVIWKNFCKISAELVFASCVW